MKKIIIAILLIIILISVYLFFFPRITVNEIEVSKSIPVKILPYKDYTNKKNDSLLVYLPYKIQIVNYSTTILKKPNFYFKSINYDHHPQFMIYDKNGINVEGLSTDGLTLEELYSRGELFPLLPKTFYVYKYNIIPAKALNMSLDSITYKKNS
ncbi:hypothetical protein EG359_05005 [Chryseobacterium joostei]|uniref:Uncharacterized protein n=1 Tax=Chryseobacterium joostei TaxID=112234 RepID=A0A1N7HVD8_9FLAO|nr:hypothetical protein [Chryseobacterium joostei]AZA99001.1 hypothetical protein EG359_05005 [Chryseobacterium joostei]SIS28700.1 hypothetical protein SAMN05421768_101361 [Chryseobacterium joostei]